MTNLEAVKERCRKLLNLAKDNAATEGEINNAIRFVNDLMAKHHLSEDDLQTFDERKENVESMKCKSGKVYTCNGKRFYAWEGHLAMAVVEIIGSVGVYIDQNRTYQRTRHGTIVLDAYGEEKYSKTLVFYGPEEDVEIAVELYYELRDTCMTMARLKYGKIFHTDGRNYCQGFASGVSTSAKENQRKNKEIAESQARIMGESTALVLIDKRNELVTAKRKRAEKWLRSETGVIVHKRKTTGGYITDRDAYANGFADGKRADTSAGRKRSRLTG